MHERCFWVSFSFVVALELYHCSEVSASCLLGVFLSRFKPTPCTIEPSFRDNPPSNTETKDSDGDGIGDNSDPYPFINNDLDSDGDGIPDLQDDFPNDITQWMDSDGDGYGDNATGTAPDAFVNIASQWSDIDGDGYGDNWGNATWTEFRGQA